ncbi:hypothetical protein [Ornithobacterium rhinotracheale]|uniref:hypothetical protein n=1 Tax=Ornithobacterium rhinotracheale TaxID=28251 RepID=UPI001FF6F740|nr:hypothetical protein [Ornithobacterium rhinotracheale]MCK0201404.1 hypothetical protein [Ornithobacterium rhinotracheale]
MKIQLFQKILLMLFLSFFISCNNNDDDKTENIKVSSFFKEDLSKNNKIYTSPIFINSSDLIKSNTNINFIENKVLLFTSTYDIHYLKLYRFNNSLLVYTYSYTSPNSNSSFNLKNYFVVFDKKLLLKNPDNIKLVNNIINK